MYKIMFYVSGSQSLKNRNQNVLPKSIATPIVLHLQSIKVVSKNIFFIFISYL